MEYNKKRTMDREDRENRLTELGSTYHNKEQIKKVFALKEEKYDP